MRVRFFAVLALLVMSLSPAIATEIKMFRQSGCGCCGQWAEHMRAAGYTVTIVDGEVMSVIKKEAGVPAALESCHTAMVDGYVIEGHVPAADVDRLLKERPKAKGLAVAGMPMGSPGMEQPDGATEPYNTVLFGGEGGDTVFQGH